MIFWVSMDMNDSLFVMRDLQERGLSTARTTWSAACD
jgi:hypothetical protein